jgi:hypothetical protein
MRWAIVSLAQRGLTNGGADMSAAPAQRMYRQIIGQLITMRAIERETSTAPIK